MPRKKDEKVDRIALGFKDEAGLGTVGVGGGRFRRVVSKTFRMSKWVRTDGCKGMKRAGSEMQCVAEGPGTHEEAW